MSWRVTQRALGCAAAVAILAAIPVVKSWSNRGYTFETSSVTPGYDPRGRLVDQAAYGLLFHTRTESKPWVVIDLGREQPIHEIEVVNRVDCCRDRAVPLRAEIALEDRKFREIATMSEPFEDWAIEAPAETRGRYVRLTATRKTMLHLHSVRVR